MLMIKKSIAYTSWHKKYQCISVLEISLSVTLYLKFINLKTC